LVQVARRRLRTDLMFALETLPTQSGDAAHMDAARSSASASAVTFSSETTHRTRGPSKPGTQGRRERRKRLRSLHYYVLHTGAGAVATSVSMLGSGDAAPSGSECGPCGGRSWGAALMRGTAAAAASPGSACRDRWLAVRYGITATLVPAASTLARTPPTAATALARAIGNLPRTPLEEEEEDARVSSFWVIQLAMLSSISAVLLLAYASAMVMHDETSVDDSGVGLLPCDDCGSVIVWYMKLVGVAYMVSVVDGALGSWRPLRSALLCSL